MSLTRLKKGLSSIRNIRAAKNPMCLDSISRKIDNPSPLIVGGWKQFSGTEDEPKFNVFELGKSNRVQLDEWITAEKVPVTDSMKRGRVVYDSGFHIYSDEKNKPGAAKRLVFYRNVEVIGTQDGFPCVIAREMYVPSKPDAWPPPR